MAAIKEFEASIPQILDQNTILLDETATRWGRSLFDMQWKIADMSSQIQQQDFQSAQIQKQLQHIIDHLLEKGHSSRVDSPISIPQQSASPQQGAYDMTFNDCMATSGAMAMQHWPCRATCSSSFIYLFSKPASAGSPTVKSWCVAPSKQLSLRGVISARPAAVLAEVKKDESSNYSAHKSNSVAGASRFSSRAGNCAYWFVKMEKPGVEVVTKAQMVDYFAQTLTKVLGNEKDAQVCVYNILWEKDYGFCCQIDEECAHELSDVPGVLSVQPDLNFESENRNYEGVISARHDTAREEIKKDYESSNHSAHQSNSVARASRFSPSVGNCAYWLVKMEKPGVEVVTKAQMVDYFAWTLTKVLGNENDAQVCIYNISWEKDYGFCCQISEECARELSDVPGVLSVQPDVNFESENKNYKVDDMPIELRNSQETTSLPDVKTKRLFVTGLSFYTSEKTLRAAFEPFGELVEVKIIMDKISKRSKGYAFIEYTTEEAAGAALREMNGKIINGWMIVVDVAKTNPPKYSRGRPRPPSSSASYTS